MKFKLSIFFNKVNIKSIIKFSLVFFIPFFIIILFLFNYTFNLEKQNTINLITEENKERAITLESIVTYMKKGIIVDLLVVKKAQEFQDFITNPNDNNKYEAEQLFYRIAKNKKEFYSILFINKEGFEEIKIVNNLNNVQIIESENLDYNKDVLTKDRERNSSIDSFYFSAIEIVKSNNSNIPIIKISNAVFDENNEFFGDLVIYFKATEFLNLFENQFDPIRYDFVELSLINSAGDYLYNQNSEKMISFNNLNTNYNINSESELFNINKEKDLDYYIENDKIYCIQTINFSKVNNAIFSNKWFLVSSFLIEDIPIVKNRLVYFISKQQFLIIIFSYIFFLVCAITIYYFQKNRNQIKLISTISNVINDSIVITDRNFNVLYINETFKKMSNYSDNEIVIPKFDYLNFSIKNKSLVKEIKETLNKDGIWNDNIWFKTKEGVLFSKYLKIYGYSKNSISLNNNYIFTYDEIKNIDNNIVDKNNEDSTNYKIKLPDENLLLELIKNSIDNKKAPFGLLNISIINYDNAFLDFSNKLIDETLNSFLVDLKIILKEDDIIAQVSRGNFSILLLSYDNLYEIIDIVDFFFNYSKNKIYNESIAIPYELKGGLSIYQKYTLSAKRLLINSHIALEESIKTNNDYLIFDEKLDEEIKKRRKINLLLRKSIFNKELSVQYQPQINITTNKVIGMEALMRWNNPELGFVSPGIFIPIAEKNGFIIKLGYWIIEKVFIDYNRIKDILPLNFSISINLSPIQFNDKQLIHKIIILSNKYNIDLSKFEIEITENIFLSNKTLVNNKIEEFKKLGLSISIDDFGTGFSSLSYIKELNIDRIKIDKSFIIDYPEKDNGSIVKIIVNICKELNLKVITEGVETQVQSDYIKALGCNFIQGYLVLLKYSNYLNNLRNY